MAPGPLAAALQSHDMFLYFGHGSGDQYLSARYRTTDYVTFDYQLHPLHLCCSESSAAQQEQLNCFVYFSGSQQHGFAVVLPMRSPYGWIACQAQNPHLYSHVFCVSRIDAT